MSELGINSHKCNIKGIERIIIWSLHRECLKHKTKLLQKNISRGTK